MLRGELKKMDGILIYTAKMLILLSCSPLKNSPVFVVLTRPAMQRCHSGVPEFAQDMAGRKSPELAFSGGKESLRMLVAPSLSNTWKGLQRRAPGAFSTLQGNLSI